MTFTILSCPRVLIGPSGCGKSTFARKTLQTTSNVIGRFRALVSDDDNDQSSTDDAFAALHFVRAAARSRKADGRRRDKRQPEARKPLVALAREYTYYASPSSWIARALCHDRIDSRPDRPSVRTSSAIKKSQLHRSLRGLGREGFRHVHVLKSQEEVDAAVIERQPLWNNARRRRAPSTSSATFTAARRARTTLQQLGTSGTTVARGLTRLAEGDLCRRPRGPRSRIVDTLKTVMSMSQTGTALSVPATTTSS